MRRPRPGRRSSTTTSPEPLRAPRSRRPPADPVTAPQDRSHHREAVLLRFRTTTHPDPFAKRPRHGTATPALGGSSPPRISHHPPTTPTPHPRTEGGARHETRTTRAAGRTRQDAQSGTSQPDDAPLPPRHPDGHPRLAPITHGRPEDDPAGHLHAASYRVQPWDPHTPTHETGRVNPTTGQAGNPCDSPNPGDGATGRGPTEVVPIRHTQPRYDKHDAAPHGARQTRHKPPAHQGRHGVRVRVDGRRSPKPERTRFDSWAPCQAPRTPTQPPRWPVGGGGHNHRTPTRSEQDVHATLGPEQTCSAFGTHVPRSRPGPGVRSTTCRSRGDAVVAWAA